MYQVDVNTKLDSKLIQEAIEFNEKKRKVFDNLYNYYTGKHNIFNRNKAGEALSNNKLMINHAKYIVKVGVGYLLGNPVTYKISDGDISSVTDAYRKQAIDNLDAKIAKDCAIYGCKYEYIYADENSEPKSIDLDVRNTIIIYDNSIVHKKLFGINYRPVYKNPDDSIPSYYDVLVVTKNEVVNGKLSPSKTSFEEVSRQSHFFGEVPIVEYHNNDEQEGDFESVISLIDAYNLIQSDRVNDREQLVDAILCFKGIRFEQEQMDDLREKRSISGIPKDGDVFYLTKNVNEADNDVLRQNINDDIHKISMVPNLSDENFAGNSSGVALRYKLLAFEQNTKDKESYFRRGLKERFALYMNFLTMKNNIQPVPLENVDIIFVRSLPSNDYEMSQMINNLIGIVDKRTLASQLSFIENADETVTIAESEGKTETTGDEYATNEFADQNNIVSTDETAANEVV